LKITRTVALAACVVFLSSAVSFAKSWRIADFQDNIVVSKDGSAVVTERISLVFEGEWHGIHRTIPIEYPGPSGTNYELFLDIKSVTDGAGSKLKYESSIRFISPARAIPPRLSSLFTWFATARDFSRITTSSIGM
jgi:hypothetical protein